MNEICSASPFSDTIKEEEIYPTLPDGLNGALDASRVKTYLKNSMYPLMVSAKYCYITHELRLHQNDRCKRFTPV